jgi:sodium/bile acid cotransporter 7
MAVDSTSTGRTNASHHSSSSLGNTASSMAAVRRRWQLMPPTNLDRRECCGRLKTMAADEPSLGRRALKFLISYHLIVGLFLGVVIGYVWPPPGKALGSIETVRVSQVCIVLIFLISGLKLKTAEMMKAIRTPKVVLLGIVSIMGVTPMLGWALVNLKLQYEEFTTGLTMFAIVPTTISSAVVITGIVKGSVALSLLLSIVTNLLGVITIPFLLSWVLGSGDIRLDAAGMLWKLCLTILLPLGVGKAASYQAAVKRFSTTFDLPLKMASSFFLCMIP